VLLLVPASAFAGPPMFKQVSLEDLGLLQLAAHDFFLVERCLDFENNPIPPPCQVIDFENGKLDLSTLFTDMTTGVPFTDGEIAMGGEPRNRENIMLFTVASSLGQNYLDFKAIDGDESAKQQTIALYHMMLADAYDHTFDEIIPNAKQGCATMTENLALRTIHDLLPGNILINNVMTPVLDPSLHGETLTVSEMAQLSANLDGFFDPEFLNIHIIIPPDVDMIINLFVKDSTFASQFNTDFTFEYFMGEISDGFYNPDEDVMKQIRSLFAKGLGDDCYVGGTSIPIDSTGLILAGAQTFSWIIPLVISGIGIGLFIVSRRSKNS
jgi:hypothetical protein